MRPADHRDVGHREGLAGHERLLLQDAVEVMHAPHGPVALMKTPRRVLMDLDVAAEARRGVMEVDADRVEQLQLGTPAHHVDQALLARRAAGQCRPAVERVQVLGDRGALGDERPVVEFEHRQRARVVPGEECGRLVLAFPEVHFDEAARATAGSSRPTRCAHGPDRDRWASRGGSSSTVGSHRSRWSRRWSRRWSCRCSLPEVCLSVGRFSFPAGSLLPSNPTCRQVELSFGDRRRRDLTLVVGTREDIE